MKRILSLLSLLAVAMFCACSSDVTEESTTGSIAGSVSDRTTGEPVATVNVRINPGGSSTVTGSDGTFTFRNLEEGSYTLTITKEGYKQSSSTVSVHAGDPTSAHLLIERIPAVVTADRELLDFGDNASTNTLSFNIVNPGYVDLAWEIEERCEWITEVKPAKGTLKYGKTEAIVVVIDRDLLASGSNEAVIVVRSSNGSSEVKVTAVGAERYVAQLNTLDATEITSSSATLNGEITNAGVPAYTERGFVYSLKSMPTFDNMIARLTSPVTEDAAYSYVLKGLALGEKYYVRAYAVNSEGTAYSTNQVQFTTQAILPHVEMDRVSNVDIANGTAFFHGTIVEMGDPSYSEKGFVYSATSSAPTIYDTKVIATGNNRGSYDAKAEGLEANRLYHVRAYAKNEAGIAYSSSIQSFSTDEILPVVRTDAATDEDREHNSVVLHGTIINAGNPPYTERGFVYSAIYESPTVYDEKMVVAGSKNTSFEYRSTALPADKSYYVRAYATNSKGTAYGETIRIFAKDVIELPAANLMVQPADIGQNNWISVNSMCENSLHEGYTDWRLPTKEELMLLYNQRDFIGGFNTEYQYQNYVYTYWSSSTGLSGYSRPGYWYLSFDTGRLDLEESSTGSNTCHRSGRCVRTLNKTN